MSVSTDLWFHVASAELNEATLSRLVAAYPDLIEGLSKQQNQKSSKYKEDLSSLDDYRYKELPELLEARRKSSKNSDGGCYLELKELQRLLEWKMSRGVFRPSLRGLIAGNSLESVKASTTEALAECASSTSSGSRTFIESIQQAVKTLCKLRGVGPATASLILSVAYPNDIPFFADELFTWLSFEDASMLEAFLRKKYPDGTGEGIEGVRTDKITGIKYTESEYKKLCTALLELKKRLSASMGTSAAEIEKASFVALQGLEVSWTGWALHAQDTHEDIKIPQDGIADKEKQNRSKSHPPLNPSLDTKRRSDHKTANKATDEKRKSTQSRKEDHHVAVRASKRRKILSD